MQIKIVQKHFMDKTNLKVLICFVEVLNPSHVLEIHVCHKT